MSVSTKVNAHEWLINVEGIRENFNSISGGNMEREVTQARNGGSNGYEQKAGPVAYSDITTGKDYRGADESWLRRFRGKEGVVRATITKQQLDENMAKVGKPTVYPNCILKSLTEPEATAGGTDITTVTMVWGTTGPAK